MLSNGDPVKGVCLGWNGKSRLWFRPLRLRLQLRGRGHLASLLTRCVSHLLNKDQGGRLPPPLSLGNQEEPITLWGMLRNTFKIDDVGPARRGLHTTTVIKASN